MPGYILQGKTNANEVIDIPLAATYDSEGNVIKDTYAKQKESAHPTYFRTSSTPLTDEGGIGTSYVMAVADLKPKTPLPAAEDVVIFKTDKFCYVGTVTAVQDSNITVKVIQILSDIPLEDIGCQDEDIDPADYDLVIRTQEEFEAFFNSLDVENFTCTATSVLLVGDGGNKVFNVPLIRAEGGTENDLYCTHTFFLKTQVKKFHGLNHPIVKMAAMSKRQYSPMDLNVVWMGLGDTEHQNEYSMKNITFDVTAEEFKGVGYDTDPSMPPWDGENTIGFVVPYCRNCHIKITHGNHKKLAYHLAGIQGIMAIDCSVEVSSSMSPFGICCSDAIINCKAKVYVDGPTNGLVRNFSCYGALAAPQIIGCSGLYKVNYTQESYNEYRNGNENFRPGASQKTYDLQKEVYDNLRDYGVFGYIMNQSEPTLCSKCTVLPEHDASKISVYKGTIVTDPDLKKMLQYGYNVFGGKSEGFHSDSCAFFGTIRNGKGMTAIGVGSIANHDNATALGYGASADADNTVRLGDKNIQVLSCQVATITTGSDERLKEEITLADTARCLADVNRLPVHRFKFKDFANPNAKDVHVTDFIAQDVQKVFPKSVHVYDEEFAELDENGDIVYIDKVDEDGELVYESDGVTPVKVPKIIVIKDALHIDRNFAVPTMWAAIQELTKKITALEGEIAELKKKEVTEEV